MLKKDKHCHHLEMLLKRYTFVSVRSTGGWVRGGDKNAEEATSATSWFSPHNGRFYKP